jgi:hypothetical protein
VTVARAVDPRRLVFVDEMGTNTSLSPLYAYALKGRRTYAQVPRNRGANTTLLASMSLEGRGTQGRSSPGWLQSLTVTLGDVGANSLLHTVL